jgi:hypothetical protein
MDYDDGRPPGTPSSFTLEGDIDILLSRPRSNSNVCYTENVPTLTIIEFRILQFYVKHQSH